LRLNQWSWYGKLIRASVDFENKDLKDAFSRVKTVSDDLFKNLSDRFQGDGFKEAFPDTSISFQFNPDTQIDIYKSALIYVDDGFNSLLQDKGSGIQSSVIIELFTYYTKNHAQAPSLLAIEEPELYLHPQARRVLSHQLDEFIDGDRNQVIVATHSPEFISSAHETLNIHVIRKEGGNKSVAYKTTFDHSKEKQILLKRHNAEMFFADMVVLVEGGDKYVVEALASEYSKHRRAEGVRIGHSWLDSHNISVIKVGGKHEFHKYFRKLKELNIRCFILADFDFFLRELDQFFAKLGKNTKQYCDELNQLRQQMGDTNGVKRLVEIPEKHHADTRAYLSKLKPKDVFIMERDLEGCFTAKCTGLLDGAHRKFGKEEKPIYIVTELVSESIGIAELIETAEFYSLFEAMTAGFPKVEPSGEIMDDPHDITAADETAD
jgi:putative ATP-dependent endonuclease of the OLD family